MSCFIGKFKKDNFPKVSRRIRQRAWLSSHAADDTTYLLMSDHYIIMNIHRVFAHHFLICNSSVTCGWSTAQTLSKILLIPDNFSELQETYYVMIHNSEILV